MEPFKVFLIHHESWCCPKDLKEDSWQEINHDSNSPCKSAFSNSTENLLAPISLTAEREYIYTYLAYVQIESTAKVSMLELENSPFLTKKVIDSILFNLILLNHKPKICFATRGQKLNNSNTIFEGFSNALYLGNCYNFHFTTYHDQMSPGKSRPWSGGMSCWDVFCRRRCRKMLWPSGSLRKETIRGGSKVTGGESRVTGDLIENHRIFLNIEDTFCMNPWGEEADDFRLIDTTVVFLSSTWTGRLSSSLSLLLEHLMVWADMDVVNLSKWVVLFFR